MSAATVTVEPAHRSAPPPGRLRRLLRGPAADPQWARPGLLGLLALTALLYLWDLSRNGYANDFYAAAVQAGTKSWKAFFFGSFDSSNFITVDKTPASLWVDEIVARVFGFNSWTLLAPQAVEGVASVLLLYSAVRRWFGPAAGLIAGVVLALTPVATLIFRFNNPDALLVLLMTAAGYAVQRAIERDRTRWLVFAGLLLGFAFLSKMAQAFLVLPGFGLAYLWAGPAHLGRRIWQLLAALGGVIVGAGWWIVIAQLTPAADRPYFGGSTDNNILELALGYNGFGRLDGSETGSIGGGGFGGSTGIFRLFGSEFGGQVSWLLPAALISLGALIWISRRQSRTSRVRAFALLWGGWLLVTGVVFSFMQGIIHPYYMVALAPAIGALVGVGAIALFQSGLSVVGRAVAAAGVLVTGIWAYELLERTPDWLPWLRWTVLLAGVLGAVSVFAVPELLRRTDQARGAAPGPGGGRARRAPALVYAPLVLALAAGLGGPLAYSLDTANSTHTGSIPSAGPTVAGSFGGGGGAPGGGAGGGFGGRAGGGFGTRTGGGTGGTAGTGGAPTGTGGTTSGGAGGFPGGPGSAGGAAGSRTGAAGHGATGGRAGTGGVAMGGLSGSTEVSSALVKLLEQDASKYKWIAATEGTQEAAPIELATGGDAVLAIGGFNGTDPAPTLAEFEAMVAKGEIHYYVGQGSESFGGGTGSSTIATWVSAHFKSETVGGLTVYNLTQEK
jgi:4-amino-4-deoxy-L-arabinose transferase-like glycosyltransferase